MSQEQIEEAETLEQPIDEKYVVFRRNEFEEYTKGRIALPEAVDDAVVIRGQDVFASAAFFNYSNIVATTRDIMLASVEEEERGDPVFERLLQIADHFNDLGAWATTLQAKLPD